MKINYLHNLTFKIFLIISIGFIASANAGLIKNGNIISDTATNIEWMELSASKGITYNQMIDNFDDVNSLFYGFEFASLSQIQSLFISEGYSGDFYNDVFDSSSRNAVSQIFDLFGQTGTNCCLRGDGMFLNENSGLVDWLFYIPDYTGAPNTPEYIDASGVRVINNRIDPDVLFWNDENQIGSWIVRTNTQSVPEPISIALFSFGLAAIRLLRKTNKSF